DAADLTVPQGAMLAGMVQSTSGLDPYTSPEETRNRRDTVIASLVDTRPPSAPQGEQDAAGALGVLERPQPLPRGCITAGSRGFFCDCVAEYRDQNGLSREMVEQGGYTIRTTLDETVQANVQRSLDTYGNPTSPGVAEVMNVIRPGE